MSHFPTAYLPQKPSQGCCSFHAHHPPAAWNPNSALQILCPCDSCCQEAQGQRGSPLVISIDSYITLWLSEVLALQWFLSGLMGEDFRKRYPYLLSSLFYYFLFWCCSHSDPGTDWTEISRFLEEIYLNNYYIITTFKDYWLGVWSC